MGLSGSANPANLGTATGAIRLDTSGVQTGIDQARSAIRGGLDGIKSAIADAMQSIGADLQNVGSSLTVALAPVTAFAAQGILAFADFDEALNEIEVRTGATGEVMDLVKAKALEMGETTAFSATDAANAMLQMLSSGYDLEQTMSALPDVLDLAASSNLDLGYSADAVTDILAQYKLGAENASVVTNALAQAAGASSATVPDMIQAFANAGPVAANYGLSIEETAAALAVFSENGIKGAEAGTQLRSLLNNMSRDVPEVKDLWDELGISMYDAQGNMRSLDAIIKDLNVALDGTSDERRNYIITTLAGSYGQIGLSALLASNGIDTMQTSMSEAATASEMAQGRMNSFRGIISSFQSSVETLSINVLGPLVTKYIMPAITSITMFLNELNGWIVKNPELAESIGLVVGVLAVLGPTVFGIGTALSYAGMLFGAVSAPVYILVAALGALYIAYRNNFLGFQDFVERIAPNVIATFQTVAAGAMELFNALTSGDFEGAGEIITNAFMGVFDQLDGIFEQLIDLLLIPFQMLGIETTGLRNVLGEFGDVLQNQIIGRLLILRTLIVGIVEAFQLFANGDSSGGFAALGDMLQSVVEQGATLTSELLGFLGSLAVEVAKVLFDLGKIFVAWIGPQIPGMLAALGIYAEALFKWVIDAGGRLLNQLGVWGAAFINWVVPIIPPLLESLALLTYEVVVWIWDQIPYLLAGLIEWTAAFINWIGPVIVDIIPVLAEFMATIIEWVLSEGLPMLVIGMVALTVAFVKWVWDAIPILLPALWELMKATLKFTIDIIPVLAEGMLTVGIAMVRGLINGLGKIGEAFLEAVGGGEVWEAIEGFIGDIFNWFEEAGAAILDFPGWVNDEFLAPIGDAISEGISDIGDAIEDFVDGVFNWFEEAGAAILDFPGWVNDEFLAPIGDTISAGANSVGESINTFIAGVFTSLGNAAATLINMPQLVIDTIIMPMVATILSFATNTASELWQAGASLVTAIFDAFKDTVRTAIDIRTMIWEDVVKPMVDRILEFVTTTTSEIWEAGRGLGKSIFDAMKDAFENVVNIRTWIIDEFIKPIADKIIEFVGAGAIWDAAKGLATSIFSAFTSAWEALGGIGSWFYNNLIAPIKNKISEFVGTAGEIWDTAKRLGEGLLKGVSEGITGAISVVESAFKSAVNRLIPDRIGITIGKIVDPILGKEIYGGGNIGIDLPNPFPGYAEGGEFGPGHMLVGEEGPEVLVTRQSGMVVSNNQLMTALNLLTGGFGNLAQMLSNLPNLAGAGASMGSGTVFNISVPVEMLKDSPNLERNARQFGELFMDEVTRRGGGIVS
jgi:TP901 family phage tail tape measure protein